MDLTLLHPKVVHLPIALAVLMPLVAAGLAVAWHRAWLNRRSWVIAVLFQLALVVSSFAAMQTGEIDEERVERVVPEAAIEAHEEAAEVFTWSAAAVLLLMVLPLVIRNESAARRVAAAAAVSTLVLFGLGYRVGEAGGALVYEHHAAQAFSASTVTGIAPHDDDD